MTNVPIFPFSIGETHNPALLRQLPEDKLWEPRSHFWCIPARLSAAAQLSRCLYHHPDHPRKIHPREKRPPPSSARLSPTKSTLGNRKGAQQDYFSFGASLYRARGLGQIFKNAFASVRFILNNLEEQMNARMEKEKCYKQPRNTPQGTLLAWQRGWI